MSRGIAKAAFTGRVIASLVEEETKALDVISGRTLVEIAAEARSEHEAVMGAAVSALEHAARAGVLLSEAKPMVDAGSWVDWLTENIGISRNTASQYMRLGAYRDLVLPNHECQTIQQAMAFLTGLPAVSDAPYHNVPKEKIEAARRMREEGMSYHAIGRLFGVTGSSIHRWINPDADKRRGRAMRQRNARARAARKALEQSERDRMIRKVGGDIADVYASIRRNLQILDKQRAAAQDEQVRASLAYAVANLHRAEDAVAKAVRLYA